MLLEDCIVVLLGDCIVVLLGDSADGSMLLDDGNTMQRSYSDNELLSSARRQPTINPSTQPNSETTSLTG